MKAADLKSVRVQALVGSNPTLSARTSPRMSDAAVQAKTGKTWKEWFAVLDRAGAREMSHKDIATYLYRVHRISGWWSQMVTVTYEQARGMREVHQRPEGYEISVSKVMPVAVSALYRAWDDGKVRRRWLKEDGMVVRAATSHKTIRMTWTDGKTSVEVRFSGKGASKSQVVVQHSKLVNASKAAKTKAYWKAALERLAVTL